MNQVQEIRIESTQNFHKSSKDLKRSEKSSKTLQLSEKDYIHKGGENTYLNSDANKEQIATNNDQNNVNDFTAKNKQSNVENSDNDEFNPMIYGTESSNTKPVQNDNDRKVQNEKFVFDGNVIYGEAEVYPEEAAVYREKRSAKVKILSLS